MKYDLIISIVSFKNLKESIKISKQIMEQLNNIFCFKILLVENGQQEKNHNFSLNKKHNSIINIHYSQRNIGYAAGHNWNISNYFEELKDDGFFIILNNDIDIDQFKLIEFLKQIKLNKLEAVSPTQLIKGIQSYPSKTLLYKNNSYDNKNRITFTDRLDGAFMVLSKNLLRRVGLLPEYYFLYFEELDYSYKIIAKNIKIAYLLDFRYKHFGTNIISVARSYFMGRNQFVFSKFIFKNLSIIYLLKSMPKTILKFFIFNKYRIYFLKGFLKGLKLFFN